MRWLQLLFSFALSLALAPEQALSFGLVSSRPTSRAPPQLLAFSSWSSPSSNKKNTILHAQQQPQPQQQQQQQFVSVQVGLDDEKVRTLFAWISRAFDGDERYNNLMLAIAAAFGDLPADAPPARMAREALRSLPRDEETPTGQAFSRRERESASLGAMGAAQWTGQWRTRPHALLPVHNLTAVDEWERSLPRGCRRTLKRALQQNITVAARPIRSDRPAPHSSLAHFRCVVDHEVRLLTDSPDSFFDALAAAVSRYMGTTQMAGEIREYRCNESGKILAFAHEVQKGRTVRGQWFYATNEGSKRYIWFHSVRSLVERAIASEHVDTVDLGPSGSDDFSKLKEKYGFRSVADWPAEADYLGPFWNYEKGEPQKNGATL